MKGGGMATALVPSVKRLVLGGVSWQTFCRLLRAFDDRHLRITYDRGALEIMTLSPQHERCKHLLGLLIGALVEELGWNMAGFGSMSFKRKKRQRGLEPDECFWIQHELVVRGRDQIDLRHDPPSDLVIEIEATQSALNRMGIYGVLKVPEVWRWGAKGLRVQLLGPDGKYADSPHSPAFPFLPMSEIERFLGMRSSLGETDLVRQFRAWLRGRIAAGWK
jgi:Uma2 family endonuclease